ncbi:MAG: hypothetical protein Fur0041_16120 [Bacteroidia bacterium]
MAAGKLHQTITEILKLPKVAITMDHTEEGHRLYRYFTKLHPKYLVFRQKTIGVGLICLNDFKNADAYMQSVNGKNSAAYFTRKAQRAGYTFRSIHPIEMADAIFAVNTSAELRQGREMDASYKTKFTNYPINSNNEYYGVFSGEELVAYLWVVKSGELAVLSRLLGHAAHLNNGVMYMLITSYVEKEINENGRTRFIMYDTFFGAGEGLKMFKSRCGFKPWRVKWKQA